MILTILYNIFILPVELLIECVYVLTSGVFKSPGVCIVAVSIVVNLLCLPLYKRSDALQDAERKKQKTMSRWVAHIKATFTGDERVMMLSTYYRQMGYKSYHALKGSASLLLQIPFFIAAFHFLSTLESLQGVSFLFLTDLGQPDGLMQVGEWTINVLPIVMTLINIASGAIYTRGFPARDKVQLYVVAAIFLVLLYSSPSGLVMYWTLNNLFSLGKNIFMKLLPNPGAVLRVVVAIAGAALLICGYLTGSLTTMEQQVFFIALALACQIPWAMGGVGCGGADAPGPAGKKGSPDPSRKTRNKIFALSLVVLAVFDGLCIPLLLIDTSPVEFLNTSNAPLGLALNCFTICVGIALWIGIFYALATPRSKRVFAVVAWALVVISLVDYLFFGTDRGTVTELLAYDGGIEIEWMEMLVNAGVVAVCGALAWLLCRWGKKLVLAVLGILLISGLAVSGYVGYGVVERLGEHAYEPQDAEDFEDPSPLCTLTATGKNVVVIMLDRAIGPFFPYLLNENPTLQRQFEGFVHYSDTVSFGGHTNFAAPALFGGYEYTPAAMNARDAESLQSKSDEALQVLPVLFSKSNYDVTVCDPPYAGYEWTPDLSIYDGYPRIQAYNTEGAYAAEYQEEYDQVVAGQQKRNFVFFSLYRTLPVFLQPIIYQNGYYLSSAPGTITSAFYESVAVLENLASLTDTAKKSRNTFLMLQNATSHNPVELAQDFTSTTKGLRYSATSITDAAGNTVHFSTREQSMAYQSCMAALIKLGDWLDYLRESGVYDNTRIVIAADHGFNIGLFQEALGADGLDTEWYAPLLLVKDFNATGAVRTSTAFMTNADVPALAISGLGVSAVNPFTGKDLLRASDKTTSSQLVTASNIWNIDVNNGTVFQTDDKPWYAVEGNIINASTWVEVDDGS